MYEIIPEKKHHRVADEATQAHAYERRKELRDLLIEKRQALTNAYLLRYIDTGMSNDTDANGISIQHSKHFRPLWRIKYFKNSMPDPRNPVVPRFWIVRALFKKPSTSPHGLNSCSKDPPHHSSCESATCSKTSSYPSKAP